MLLCMTMAASFPGSQNLFSYSCLDRLGQAAVLLISLLVRTFIVDAAPWPSAHSNNVSAFKYPQQQCLHLVQQLGELSTSLWSYFTPGNLFHYCISAVLGTCRLANSVKRCTLAKLGMYITVSTLRTYVILCAVVCLNYQWLQYQQGPADTTMHHDVWVVTTMSYSYRYWREQASTFWWKGQAVSCNFEYRTRSLLN